MKTTVDIADSILASAKRIAARENVTLRALIEEGLRSLIAQRRAGARPFALRAASFKGDGVHPGVDLGNWEQVRSLAYDEVV